MKLSTKSYLFGILHASVLGITIACATMPSPVPRPVPAPPAPALLLPLHTEPNRFVDAAGKEFRWKGVSDFSLFWRYLNGENIQPVLQDRFNVGANLVRVLGMFSVQGGWPVNFAPNELWFQQLRPFVDLLANYHLRVEFVVFADAQDIMPDQATQLAHWDRVIVTLGDKNNVFLQVANQSAKNGVDPSVFPNPQDHYPQLLASRDNPFEDTNPPPANGFAYNAFCSTRTAPKWFAETGSSLYYVMYGWGPGNGWDGTGAQSLVVLDEPMGASETDQPGRRSNNAFYFKRLAQSLVWGNGAVFHSDDGISSQLFRPFQHNAAVEFLGNLP